MNEKEIKQLEAELTERFSAKFPDIKTHVDVIKAKDEINISFFWNRKSRDNWNGAKTFRFKTSDYDKVLVGEIIPFFA